MAVQAGAAIRVKYLGPTDHRGARWTAVADVDDPVTGNDPARVTIPYPYEYSGMKGAEQAAIALCRNLGWDPDLLIGGYLLDGSYVFLRTWQS